MLGSLITLPFRIGIRGAEAALHTSQAMAERALGLLGQVIAPTAKTATEPGRRSGQTPETSGEVDSSPSQEPDQGPIDPRSQAQPAAETVSLENREPVPREPEQPPAPAPAREPDRVSEDATVVEAVSEPGAEDGAGAQIHVAEPWDGYGEMKAADIIDRIRGTGAAELAAVELYELSHRKRQTVIEAVSRELRLTQNPRQ